jgi:hypothetical protein
MYSASLFRLNHTHHFIHRAARPPRQWRLLGAPCAAIRTLRLNLKLTPKCEIHIFPTRTGTRLYMYSDVFASHDARHPVE